MAAYNIWHAESARTAREFLAAANEHAARTILDAVKAGDVRVAMAVMKGMGTLKPQREGRQIAALVADEISDERSQLKRSLGSLTPAMRKENAQKALEDKRAAEEAAKKEARRDAQWKHFEGIYLQIPPLPRPITRGAVEESAKAAAGKVRVYSRLCSFTIVAVSQLNDEGRELLIGRLAEDQTLSHEEAGARLQSLPWLTNYVRVIAEAESHARLWESLGATVELRPSWVE